MRRSDARTGIFDNAGAFADRRGSEHTNRMNARGTNDKSHATNFARLRGLEEDEKWKKDSVFGFRHWSARQL